MFVESHVSNARDCASSELRLWRKGRVLGEGSWSPTLHNDAVKDGAPWAWWNPISSSSCGAPGERI
jgi:hypothetical protein